MRHLGVKVACNQPPASVLGGAFVREGDLDGDEEELYRIAVSVKLT